ncbi:hypothetical protein E3P84_02015 [Wallemia ichthyophaga]|nr:hypothetical protein E3P95_01949 [Wallemia ichthyophaga]TIB00789.1 hypothetical protein E3P94_02073 [Wallemia ichthyophaga]TIB33841.1 hypothetical protein E3P84_02015 [Wallemia ichthyophaga]TIB41500.1 hypothetical protein E3P83_01967 [Wallemia ichthyophaga]
MTLASILENSSHVAVLASAEDFDSAESTNTSTHSLTLNGKPVVLTRAPFPHADSVLEQHSTASDQGRALVAAAFTDGAEGAGGGVECNTNSANSAIDEQLHRLSIRDGDQGAFSETQKPQTPPANPPAHATVPSTRRPSIQPQLSRAAMLRMGITPPPKREQGRANTSESARVESREGKLDRDRATPKPKSLGTPKIQVRQSRSSQLRRGSEGVEGGEETLTAARRRTSSTPVDYSSTPGHRRASMAVDVASTRQPVFTPRQTRASRLRLGGGEVDETSRSPSALSQSNGANGANRDIFANTPGHRRASIIVDVASTRQPAFTPRQTRASRLRMGSEADEVGEASVNGGRPSSTLSRRSSTDTFTFASTPGHKRALSIPVKSTNTPSIAARENKSSALRANRMSTDVHDSTKKPFNLSTSIAKDKFVEFDKKKVKPVKRDSGGVF